MNKEQKYQIEINSLGTRKELIKAYKQFVKLLEAESFEQDVDEANGDEFPGTMVQISAEITPIAS